MKALVIAAHPDDEVLGCGGTIARMASDGHEVTIAIMGEGITSRYTHREAADQEQIRLLHQCSENVAQLLGATQLLMHSMPDNRFDSLPLLDVVKVIENWIAAVQPDVVYTQHGGDLNIDHVVLFRATLTATRPLPGQTVKAVYAYEVPSSTEWAFQQFEPYFRPNRFVDITDTLDVKVRAMEMYDSEARCFPHPRSSAALRAIAQRWGSVAAVGAAEAFAVIRSIE